MPSKSTSKNISTDNKAYMFTESYFVIILVKPRRFKHSNTFDKLIPKQEKQPIKYFYAAVRIIILESNKIPNTFGD